MRHINARITVRVTLDSGESREFDFGTIDIEHVDEDETVVDITTSAGDTMSSENFGDNDGSLAWRIGQWLNEIGIRDEGGDYDE